MFLSQSERPSFAPIQHNWQNDVVINCIHIWNTIRQLLITFYSHTEQTLLVFSVIHSRLPNISVRKLDSSCVCDEHRRVERKKERKEERKK
jgi:hypothetical protein